MAIINKQNVPFSKNVEQPVTIMLNKTYSKLNKKPKFGAKRQVLFEIINGVGEKACTYILMNCRNDSNTCWQFVLEKFLYVCWKCSCTFMPGYFASMCKKFSYTFASS